MIICVFACFHLTLLVSRVLVLAQELNIEPNGGTLTVGLGMSQTILCHGTVDTVYTEPKWTGPKNANYTINNSRSDLPNGQTIIESKLVFNYFRLEDEGTYRCSYQSSVSHTWEAMIQLIAGCPYGRYGESCNKCSQYCVAPTDTLISPCNLINGTCVAGCRQGYRGHRCDQSIKDSTTTTITDTTNIDNDNVARSSNGTDERVVIGIVLGVVILVVVIVLIILGVCCCKRRRVACFGQGEKFCIGVTPGWKKKQTDEAIEDGPRPDDPMLKRDGAVAMGSIPDQDAASTKKSGKSKGKSGGTQTDGSVTDTDTSTENYSSKDVDKIRYIFTNEINPLSVIQLFHNYNTDVLTNRDIDCVTAITKERGKCQGADELFSRLPHYEGWYKCLQKVLRDDHVKLGHVADAMNKEIESRSS